MDQKKKKQGTIGPSIWNLLKPYTGWILLVLLFTLLGNSLNLFIPRIIARAIDSFGAGTFNRNGIIAEFAGAAGFIFIFLLVQNILQTYASERVALDLRNRLSDKVSRLAISDIQAANPSKLLTNLTSDIDSIKMFVSQALASIVSSLVIILGASAMLLSINWRLALAVLSIIPVIAVTFFVVLKRVRVLFRRSREVIDWLNRVINESILGAAIIRVLNAQQPEYAKFLAANSRARDLGLNILSLFATLIPVITFVANLATLTVLCLGGHYVIIGQMTLGNFAAFNSYIALLVFPIIIIGFMSNVIAQASASYGRIQSILNRPETREGGTIRKNLGGSLEVKDLSLSFGQKEALKKVFFRVQAGSRTAILGPTAAGKTQLLYLLAGLIRPDSGEIRFDGIPIGDLDPGSLQVQIGIVFQESSLFNLSLRENIAFSPTASSENMARALSSAELDDFIGKLPQGLDTMVSERGTSLSGGQKQRLMLARALTIEPRILLLDDFTARVDPPTEKRILDNLSLNYPGITLISVTQKISSVTGYDQIILMMEGEIIAIGRHEELMGNCPEYIQIYQSQRSTSHYELQPE